MRTKWFMIVALASTFVSVARAGAPLGPPTAMVGEGRWGLGAEYGYEEISLEAFGKVTESLPGVTFTQLYEIEDLRSNMFFGRLAYGVCDTWDIFVRLGAADARDDILALDPGDPGGGDTMGFDGSYGFAWGVGTRTTFCRSGPWSVGGAVQVTWFRPGDSDFTLVEDPARPEEVIVGDLELDYWQTQISLAAMYQVDTWSFWAGPFLQFVDGDMELNGRLLIDDVASGTVTGRSDLEEASQIGGHFGANWRFANQWSLWLEGQITEDSWLVGIGVVLIPEKAFGM